MRHNIRGVKSTPASRRRYKIGLPIEGLNVSCIFCPIPWKLVCVSDFRYSFCDFVLLVTECTFYIVILVMSVVILKLSQAYLQRF